MDVIRAEEMGMCFGVRDALEAARNTSQPTDVTIRGELVHNGEVLKELDELGFSVESEASRTAIPNSPAVMVTAHGVSNAERERLLSHNKRVIDTTCPLVKKAHDSALELSDEGFHVVVIGRADHVEVRGLVGDLSSYDVFAKASDVTQLGADKIGVIAQTTSTGESVTTILARIRELHPEAEIRFVDTVCQPTKDRQRAIENLIPTVDAVVVVGGKNSNNTRRLADSCRDRGVPAFHVECAGELDPTWFAGLGRVGLTAGTSTLDRTIDEVHERLLSFAG